MSRAAADLWLTLAALGLALPVNLAGLPVAGAGAFVAVGAYATALLAGSMPLLLAVVAGVGIACAAGLVVAVVAARLDGQELALASWATAWLAWIVASDASSLADGRLVRTTVVSPSLGLRWHLGPTVHVVVAAVLCLLVLGATARVARGPAGAELAVLRESPALAASLGIPVVRRRVALIVAAAGVAGLAGAGTLLLQGVVAPGDVTPLVSLDLFAAVLLGGRWLGGPLVGTAVVLAIPTTASHLVDLTGGDARTVHALLTALLLVVAVAVRGLVPERTRSRDEAAAAGSAPAPVVPSGVRAAGIRVRYDGVQALDGVDLDVRPGEVHALIGPNGSGKTTLLRVLSGDVRPDAGRVLVDDRDVTRQRGWRRVRHGVARAPQQTVEVATAHAVQLDAAARAADPRGSAVRHLLGGRSAAATTRSRRARSRQRSVGEGRDTTTLRLLQVARAAATQAPVLLLDEPAAGVTTAERPLVAQAIRALAAEGRAVVLVEHDIRLVASVADRVTVLDAGRVIAHGAPDEVRNDPKVITAYLGAPTLAP